MKCEFKISGIPIVIKSVRKLRDTFEFEDSVSDEFKAGVYYALDSIIETLEKVEESEND